MTSPKPQRKSTVKSVSSLMTDKKFSDGLSFLDTYNKLMKTSDVSNSSQTEHQLECEEQEKSCGAQKWLVWYWKADHRHVGYTPVKRLKWADMLTMKAWFTTHQQFWDVYSELNGFHMTRTHCDYFVFKDGIKPMWEHIMNRDGGRWILTFPKRNNWKYNSHLDEIWLKLLLSLIGGSFDSYKREICGVTLNIRVGIDKITLWTANANNTLINLKIGEILKSSTGYKGLVCYDSHSSTENKSITNESKNRFYNYRN